MNAIHLHCSHFALCSGCCRNEYVDQLGVWKEISRFFSNKGISSFQLKVGNPAGWRCRAKLAVRGTALMPYIGLFEEGTHHINEIPHCRIHHPAINKAVAILRSWIIKYAIAPYNEKTGEGLLRYVQLTVERATGRVQLALVLNRGHVTSENIQQFEALWQEGSNLWHSLWLNFNRRRDNVIFGFEWFQLCGFELLAESLCERLIYFHPACFIQANLEMFEHLLERIKILLPQKADVIEFYAGVGTIGFVIVEKCSRIRCVEISLQAKLCFDKNHCNLPKNLASRLSFYMGKSSDYAHLLEQIDPELGVAIVDPPRKGLERALLDILCVTKNLNKIIYISCGWSGFQRDCNYLIEAGWVLIEAEAFLFFPGSEHVEILAVFKRK